MTHPKNINSQNNQKVFLFDENRETLILNEKPNNQYKYDYIFSDSENPMIISTTLNAFIYPLIEAEKNITFMTIGQKGLNLSNFLFGSNQNFLLGYDSLFNYVFKAIKQMMIRIKYDKILLELYKIINDKFVIDFKEIFSDVDKISFLENINQHIQNKVKSIGQNQSQKRMPKDEPKYEDGHIILKIKFFKFLSNNDASKSQRQIEIIRTFSFIDIKDDENDNMSNSSINNFKKMVQCITNYDLNKFTELSSNLTDILREIFSVPKLYTFIFGLINEIRGDINKSLKTLNLLNVCKNIDNDKFYSYLYQMNISISRLENKAVKEEFQVLDLLFGEIIYYLEKTFKKLDKYYSEVKDLELKQKFFYLKEWLIKNNYNFQKNQNFCIVLENILGYIKNRAQWMQLMKAKAIIMKLTEGLKNYSSNNISTNNNTMNKYKILKNNEIYNYNNKTYNGKISSMDSDEKIFKDLDKEMGNSKSTFNTYNNNTMKNKNISNNGKKNNINNINNNQKDINKRDKSSSLGLSDLSFFDTKNKKKAEYGSRSIGEFPTGAKSIESSFSQKIFKGLQDNFRRLFNDLYFRFTAEEESCISCKNSEPINKNYKLNCQKWVSEYKSLSKLESGINMDKISVINRGNNNHNNSSYYDKNEEIKIHFYEDEQSLKNNQKLKQKINNINRKMNEIGIKNVVNKK